MNKQAGGSQAGLRPSESERHLLLRVENLSKTYSLEGSSKGRSLRLFENLAFGVAAGQMVAIVGQSGVGKSTLLHLLGALDRPTSGQIWCDGLELGGLSSIQAARFRNQDVGYVWQFHYLLPEFTALENVAMPLMARGMKANAAAAKAAVWMKRVGLADRRNHRSGELSGGEQQRVSLARALITEPKLLLADEPTGDLDGATADNIFQLLKQLHQEAALTSVLVTHNMALAERCDRVLRLSNDGMNEQAKAATAPYVE